MYTNTDSTIKERFIESDVYKHTIKVTLPSKLHEREHGCTENQVQLQAVIQQLCCPQAVQDSESPESLKKLVKGQ